MNCSGIRLLFCVRWWMYFDVLSVRSLSHGTQFLADCYNKNKFKVRPASNVWCSMLVLTYLCSKSRFDSGTSLLLVALCCGRIVVLARRKFSTQQLLQYSKFNNTHNSLSNATIFAACYTLCLRLWRQYSNNMFCAHCDQVPSSLGIRLCCNVVRNCPAFAKTLVAVTFFVTCF